MNGLHYIKIERTFLIGEAKNSVILKLPLMKIWVPKKMIKTSEFTLYADIAVCTQKDFNYAIVDTENTISGIELIKALVPITISDKVATISDTVETISDTVSTKSKFKKSKK